MVKKLFVVMAMVLLVAWGAVGHADVVVGAGGWQSWTVGDLNQNGTPYWDGASTDGGQKNIGYYISATGGFSTPGSAPGSPASTLKYWGMTGGAADTNFYMDGLGSTTHYGTLLLEIAGMKTQNSFGWYVKGDKTARTEIFNGAAGPSAVSVAFTPTVDFGFYFKTGQGNIFFTESYLNIGKDAYTDIANKQQFAVFAGPSNTAVGPAYWMGMEDLAIPNSDADFNDMVVKVTAVPEPGTMMLLGSGLIGIAGWGRKKFRA
jgi:hypothetical protein